LAALLFGHRQQILQAAEPRSASDLPNSSTSPKEAGIGDSLAFLRLGGRGNRAKLSTLRSALRQRKHRPVVDILFLAAQVHQTNNSSRSMFDYGT